jgi:hypothetical protein
MPSRRGPVFRIFQSILAVCSLVFAFACSDTSGQGPSVAEEAAANIENANELMDEQYKKSRAEGEGRIEAAGDAYNALLDKNLEKAGVE